MTVVYGGGEFPAYVIDEETLREELLDEQEAQEWCEETPQDPNAVSFWRMLGDLDRALEAGQERLFDRDPGTAEWATAAVRLAHVHHWRREYALAHELLDAAQEVFADDEVYSAFVLQHRAKALFDEGRLEAALTSAAAALEMRERHGDAGLVASSRQTLDRIRRELGPGPAVGR